MYRVAVAKRSSRSRRVPLVVVLLLVFALAFEVRQMLPGESLVDSIDSLHTHAAGLSPQQASGDAVGLRPFDDCGDMCPRLASRRRQPRALGPSDAVFAVDHLLNWHWCPSARIRQRSLDGKVYSFLGAARARGALIVHAVSDSKNHYLLDPLVAPFVKRDSDAGTLELPAGLAHDWGWIDRKQLNALAPPVSLSLDKVCGDEGAKLFGDNNRKPAGMPGLNHTRLVRGDVVATEQNAIYTAVKRHATPVQRIFFVGVHLQLCILYSRWFAMLRVAKAWGLNAELGIVVGLTDVSNTNLTDDYRLQTKVDVDTVHKTACWIRCKVAPAVLGGEVDDVITLYDF